MTNPQSDPPTQPGAPQQPAAPPPFGGTAPPAGPPQYSPTPPAQPFGSGPSDAPAGWGPPPPPGQLGQFGQPGQPGQPGTPGSGQGETNRLAIVSLVLGLLTPLLLIPGILGVIFGAMALSQIRQRGQRGAGLAIGGIVAAGAWLIVGVMVLVALAISAGADRDDSGEITSGGQVAADAVREGDCLNDLREGTNISTVNAVPCGEPHDAQVYALFDLADGAWPGEDEVFAQADDGCLELLARDFPETYDDFDVEVFYLYPSEGTWRTGDREIVCVALYADGKRTGSLFD
jgi:hypothetical protein